jgi:hypothetical protein
MLGLPNCDVVLEYVVGDIHPSALCVTGTLEPCPPAIDGVVVDEIVV